MDLLIQLEKTFRANVDPRRQQEKADSRMIREDHKAMANLSETPVYHEFDPWRDVERLKSY
jgi:hypothetical protein